MIRNATLPYLLKNITNELGGLTLIDYEPSTKFDNADGNVSRLGFNIWVVKTFYQNNSLQNDFNIFSNTSYNYFGGKYDYDDSEFRGFNIVNETLDDKSVISHYFHQNKQLKGKEYKTETFDRNGNILSATENNFNFTAKDYGIFVTNLISTSNYQYDGTLTNPKIVNVSYKYDNYSNVINKPQFGDVSINGDEKYENYTYAINLTPWILDKVSWHILFDSSYNKIRETKYFYDNKEYGSVSSKGELTKTEQWLNTGGGNPTTTFTYDSFGNLYQQTDALGRTTTWDYGLRDITNTYADRIVNPLGHATDYVYDVGTGNIISYTKNGITSSYEYDVFGRILKDIDPYDSSDFPTKSYTYLMDGTAPETIKVSQKTNANNTIDTYYFYDGFANLVQIKSSTDSGQVVKNLLYDGMFRVKQEQNPYFDSFSTILSNVSNTTNKTSYVYDAAGRVVNAINPDGTKKNTTYNKWEINDYDENNNRHTYLLDSYDRIIAVTEYLTDYYILDNLTFNTTYSYNGKDELTGIKDAYGNNFNFSYDSLGRKIKLQDPDLGTWTYAYDLAGNLISQTGGGGNLVTGDSYYREYNGLGQLQRVRNGNTSSGNILEEYFYDSNGDRIRVNRYSYAGGTNETIYTPYKEWMQIRNSSGTFNFYYIYDGNTLVTRVNSDGTKYFYHPDHLGSTSLITDQSGNVVENEFFSPYGESLSTNNAEEFKLYTGQFKDKIDCQYYYGARYFNPCRIVFVQPDPIIQDPYNSQALNHYMYVWGNPYKAIDPNGKTVVIIQGGLPNEDDTFDNVALTEIGESRRSSGEPVGYFITADTYDEVKNFVQNQGSDQPVQIVGYSYGGGRALEYANQLEEEGIAVDALITIDPFQRTKWNSQDISPEEAFTSGVKINFYQTNQQLGTGSRGQPKTNMLNLNVGSITNTQNTISHTNIRSYDYVQTTTKEVLQNVYNQKTSSTWNSYGVTSRSRIIQSQSTIINYGSSGFQKLARSRGLI